MVMLMDAWIIWFSILLKSFVGLLAVCRESPCRCQSMSLQVLRLERENCSSGIVAEKPSSSTFIIVIRGYPSQISSN